MAFAGDVIIEEGAQASRIHVGRLGKVQDSELLRAAHENLLKFEQVAQGNRTVQAKDPGIRRVAGNNFKGQRFVIHSIRDCKKRGRPV